MEKSHEVLAPIKVGEHTLGYGVGEGCLTGLHCDALVVSKNGPNFSKRDDVSGNLKHANQSYRD